VLCFATVVRKAFQFLFSDAAVLRLVRIKKCSRIGLQNTIQSTPHLYLRNKQKQDAAFFLSLFQLSILYMF
jgi:hypothetical protein